MVKDDQTGERFGYAIYTDQLTRPMGNITHIAKVSRMVDRKLKVDVNAAQFGEAWGENAEIAKDKMTATVNKWISNQAGES